MKSAAEASDAHGPVGMVNVSGSAGEAGSVAVSAAILVELTRKWYTVPEARPVSVSEWNAVRLLSDAFRVRDAGDRP